MLVLLSLYERYNLTCFSLPLKICTYISLVRVVIDLLFIASEDMHFY